ncbi:MAG: isoleucine--tRNA ligase [Candidatus Aenigmatarchaeota archaeon]
MPTHYNSKEIENEILQFWEKINISEVIKKSREKNKKFYLLDGPPYVNDVAHIGHARTTFSKDVLAKFKIMQGYNVWLQPGFDCHGLPIETKVEKELGITKKSDIEKIGVDNFINACISKVLNNEKKWLDFYKKFGVWRGWFEPYFTYKNYFIESAWWTLKKYHEKGLLVCGEKPIFWCWRCETALSGYEVTDSYVDLSDPGIYIKFKIKNKENEFLIVYTTTPWTLPGNVAIAVNPKEKYVKVKFRNEIYIIAEKRVKPIFEELLKEKYEIIDIFDGEELDGLEYEPILNVPCQNFKGGHKVILSIPVMVHKKYKKHRMGKEEKEEEEFSEFVTMDEGSGLVHTAPGHGPSDYEIGKYYQLPVVSPVNEKGILTEEAGKFSGMFVKDADKEIIKELEKNNRLLFKSTIVHSYPVCWRCKSPLIYRNSKQWFLKIDPIKDIMIEENEKVEWLPNFAKQRFRNWLENSIDWCLSQQRYWGIPMPIWKCENCEKIIVVDSEAMLRELSDTKLPDEIDLHRNTLDKITFTCNCGGKMKRVEDILNVWFDSGITPWASLGYPYKNKELFEKLWEVDAISESQDQIRGWFYSLMFCSAALFGKSPYKQVRMIGWVLDEKGEKMSKSLGNVIWANEAIEKLGSDAIRLYYCYSTPLWETKNFSANEVENIISVLNTLWNVYQYYVTYSKFYKKQKPKFLPEDKWIISRINTLTDIVTKAIEKFELHVAGREIIEFILSDLSRFYLKLIKDRTAPYYTGSDKAAAFQTLEYVLNKLIKLLAPICPFISEKIYQDLFAKTEKCISVHICKWPEIEKIDADLERQMEICKEIINASYEIRQEKNIKLKYLLNAINVYGNEEIKEAIKNLKHIILLLGNVRNINFELKKVKYIVKPNWPVLGKKFGKDSKEIAELLKNIDAEKIKKEIEKKGKTKIEKFEISSEDIKFEEISEEGKKITGGIISLDTSITEELKEEWFFREFIRAVQEKRKKEGLKIGEKIKLYSEIKFNEEKIKKIENETDSTYIIEKPKGKIENFEFEGKKYSFGIEY